MERSKSIHWLIKNRVWGLTGGAGCGKSLVGKFFSDLGFFILDADRVARRVRDTNPTAKKKIRKLFGTLDRKKIRQQIFEHHPLKAQLEKILFPLIRQESLKILKGIFKKNPQARVIYEASQLIESQRYRDFQGPIVVTASTRIRALRLSKRDKIKPNFAKKMIAGQMKDTVRTKYAEWVLRNDSTLGDLRRKVLTLSKKIIT